MRRRARAYNEHNRAVRTVRASVELAVCGACCVKHGLFRVKRRLTGRQLRLKRRDNATMVFMIDAKNLSECYLTTPPSEQSCTQPRYKYPMQGITMQPLRTVNARPMSVPLCKGRMARAAHRACKAQAEDAPGSLRLIEAKYMATLSPEERVEALAKLSAQGYNDEWEEKVARLTTDDLEEIGIESPRIRGKLLQAFATEGPCKRIKFAIDGVEVEAEFRPRQFAQFLKDQWARNNDLLHLRPNGTCQPALFWCDLEEGHTYEIKHWR